jgi:2,3-bisphosphoglycerate-dependent phosphoglycerate mutase
MSGKLILLRHAESVWNKENRFSGESDTGLTPEGIRQSVKAIEELQSKGIDFQIVFSSNQKRAVDTLQIMLRQSNKQVPVIITKELRETELGLFNGRKIDELEKEYGKDYIFSINKEFNAKAPDKEGVLPAESLKDLSLRVGTFYDKNIASHIAKGKNVLIVAHDGTLRGLLMHITNFDENTSRIIEFENAKPYIYEYKEDII